MIYEVKRSERGDNFKKKISWAMRDLKVLDAKDATKVKILYVIQFLGKYCFKALIVICSN